MNTTFGRIYGRFSSKPQERGDSKRRQIQGAIDYARKHNIQLVGEPFFDEGVSGKAGLNLEKEFGRLLRESQGGEIILVEALDRLGRQNPFILGKLLYDTVQKGITVIAWQEGKVITKDNIDNLDTQFSVFAGAAVGHADNKRKMDRLIETTQNAYKLAEKGIQSGTLRKYLPECFQWNEETKTITFDESKAVVIRRIFQMYAEGLGSTVICHKLNETKTPTIYRNPHSLIGDYKPWMETSIKKILRNESYTGVLSVKGQKFTCIPQIVDRDLFDKVQLLLQRNIKRSGKLSGRINNLFAGIGVCKYCNGTINVNVTQPDRTGGKTFYTYRCKNARLKVCPQPHKMLNAKTVERAFFGHFFGGSPETLFGSKDKELTMKIESLQNRINKLNTSIKNLYDLVEEGDKEAKSRIALRKNEKIALENELVLLRGSKVEINNVPSLLDEIKQVMDFEDVSSLKNVSYQDLKKVSAMILEYYPKIDAKLADHEIRRKLVNLLPSLMSKVVFDCINKTIQPFTKDGRELDCLDLTPMKEPS